VEKIKLYSDSALISNSVIILLQLEPSPPIIFSNVLYFSFFAGYMTKEEADRLIGNEEKVGTHLIRFSSTYAQDGSFVVCLKTNSGAEHVLLKVIFLTRKI
jgi:hypothetical protein